MSFSWIAIINSRKPDYNTKIRWFKNKFTLRHLEEKRKHLREFWKLIAFGKTICIQTVWYYYVFKTEYLKKKRKQKGNHYWTCYVTYKQTFVNTKVLLFLFQFVYMCDSIMQFDIILNLLFTVYVCILHLFVFKESVSG